MSSSSSQPPSYHSLIDSELSQKQNRQRDDPSEPDIGKQFLCRSSKRPCFLERFCGFDKARSNETTSTPSDRHSATYNVVFPSCFHPVRLWGLRTLGCDMGLHHVMLWESPFHSQAAEPIVLLQKAGSTALAGETKKLARSYLGKVVKEVEREVEWNKTWCVDYETDSWDRDQFKGTPSTFWRALAGRIKRAESNEREAKHWVRRLKEYLEYVGELESHHNIVEKLEKDVECAGQCAARMLKILERKAETSVGTANGTDARTGAGTSTTFGSRSSATASTTAAIRARLEELRLEELQLQRRQLERELQRLEQRT